MDRIVELLPTINASFNAIAACCVVAGWRAAKAHDRERHRKLMMAALCASAFFLAGYLIRMVIAGPTPFVGGPLLKKTYLVILFSHMILAAATPPLVIRTVYLAVKDRIEEHRRLVRWTLPIWLYVSVTGVVVYVLLFHVSEAAH
jgi:putative membrane protein